MLDVDAFEEFDVDVEEIAGMVNLLLLMVVAVSFPAFVSLVHD